MVLVRPDADGTVRRYQRYVQFGDTQLPTLVGRMVEVLELDMRDEGIIDYAVGEAIEYVPLQDVLAWQEAGDTQRITETFADRFVFLGVVLPFTDRHDLPVRLAAWEPDRYHLPGVLIHAQALRSVQSGGLIAPAPAWTGVVAVMLMSLLWWLGGRPVLGVAVALITALGLWGASTWLLWNGTYFPVAGVLVAGFLAVGGRMAAEGGLSFREKRRLRRSFSRYVSPHVLSEILAGSLRPELGGERRRVCVLFSDIRGFTTRSENAPPEFTIAFLNRYFEAMTRTIHRYDGTIGTFMGDGIFAFYGAPRVLKNPSRNAFLTAQLMLKRLAEFNEKIKKEGLELVSIGIGLHSGDAVIGHVGSEARNEYTAIGDTVNTAARLEGVTKNTGYPVALSEATAKDLDDEWPLIDCGLQPLKGRADVRVFGWQPEAPKPVQD
jgi:class 3 adenylate cyclase